MRNHLAFADLIRRGVEDRAAAGGSVESTPASSVTSGDEAAQDARVSVKESAEAAAAREDRWGRIVALSDEFRATEGRAAPTAAPQLENGEAGVAAVVTAAAKNGEAGVAAVVTAADSVTEVAGSGEGGDEVAPEALPVPVPETAARQHVAMTDVESLD